MTGARRTLKNLHENNPGASKQEIRRLFLDAIMTDPEFAEVLVREVQYQMFAFDADRAREVIRMLADDAPAAESAFTSMLRDMRSHWGYFGLRLGTDSKHGNSGTTLAPKSG